MRQISDAVRAALLTTHGVEDRAELLDARDEVIDTPLIVVGGSVNEDWTAPVRHYATVELADPDGTLVPLHMTDLLAPFGARLRLSRGITPQGASEPEWILLGTYYITAAGVQRDDAGRATIQLTCMDRVARMQRALAEPYSLPVGVSIADAIARLIGFVDPTAVLETGSTPYLAPPTTYTLGADAIAEAKTLAQAAGLELYASRDDTIVIAPAVADTRATPSWSWAEGDTCTVVSGSWSWEADQRYNGVIVDGTAATGEAWDDTPTSPTFRGGAFGSNPKIIANEKITDGGQADNAAAAELRKLLRQSQEVTLEVVPAPHVEAGDSVGVDLPSLGLAGNYRVKTSSLPLADAAARQSFVVQRGVVFD